MTNLSFLVFFCVCQTNLFHHLSAKAVKLRRYPAKGGELHESKII